MSTIRPRQLLLLAAGCAGVLGILLWSADALRQDPPAPTPVTPPVVAVAAAPSPERVDTAPILAPQTRPRVEVPTPLPVDVPPEQEAALLRMLSEARAGRPWVRKGVAECVLLKGVRVGHWVPAQVLKPAPSLDLAAGDTIHLSHYPEHYQEEFGASTPYADLVPGDVRQLLMMRDFLGRSYLMLAGRPLRRVDFAALAAECAWPEARDFVGDPECSVIEAEWVAGPAEPRVLPKDSEVERLRITLRITRVVWSASGLRAGQVVRLVNGVHRNKRDAEDDPTIEITPVLQPEWQGRALLVVARHSGLQLDFVSLARPK